MTPTERYEKLKRNHTYENDSSRIDCDVCAMIFWYENALDRLSSYESQIFLASKEGKIFCATVGEVDVYLVTEDQLVPRSEKTEK